MRRTVVLAACLGLVWPGRLAVAGPEPVRAGLEVDASAMGEAGPGLTAQLESRGNQTRLDAEVLKARSPEDPLIRLVVAPLPDNGGYTLEATLVDDGETRNTLTRVCELCTEAELVDKAGAAIAELIATLRAASPSESNPDPLVGPETKPAEPPADDPKPPDETKKLGGLGATGIAGLVAGAGLAGTGVALVVKGKVVRVGADGKERQDFETPGYALLGVGGALIVGGVVLLVLDRVRARPGPAASNSPRLWAAPWGEGESGGLSLFGTF